MVASIDEKESKRREGGGEGGEDLCATKQRGNSCRVAVFQLSRSGMERGVYFFTETGHLSRETFGRSSPQTRTPDGVRAVYVIRLLGELSTLQGTWMVITVSLQDLNYRKLCMVGWTSIFCPLTGPSGCFKKDGGNDEK